MSRSVFRAKSVTIYNL
uniref:Uncharacterized protein n=1 Tax=Anguilla anguilla TaxID=7936 RepID=A0A0E9UMY7_ANGAN